MKYYLIQITTDTEGTEARAITPYESKMTATAQFHTELGYAMNNPNVSKALIQVINEAGEIIKRGPFTRPVETPVEPVSEPVEEA